MVAAEITLDQARNAAQAARARWLGALARASAAELAVLWAAQPPAPPHEILRRPETGLLMVRGRQGGAGDPFNLGEMTVTRAAVRLATGESGVGYVQGRDKTHALTAALIDALLQTDQRRDTLLRTVIEPLIEAAAQRRAEASRKSAATKVEFFTMVRDRVEPK